MHWMKWNVFLWGNLILEKKFLCRQLLHQLLGRLAPGLMAYHDISLAICRAPTTKIGRKNKEFYIARAELKSHSVNNISHYAFILQTFAIPQTIENSILHTIVLFTTMYTLYLFALNSWNPPTFHFFIFFIMIVLDFINFACRKILPKTKKSKATKALSPGLPALLGSLPPRQKSAKITLYFNIHIHTYNIKNIL